MSTDAPQIETPEMPALVIGSDVAEATDGSPAVERVAPTIRGKVDRFGVCWGTGRRKTAVARVRVKDGSGQITVNGRAMTEYFPLITDQHAVLAVEQVALDSHALAWRGALDAEIEPRDQ